MPYATTQDLVNRFGETVIKQLAVSVDSVMVEQALLDASAEIDGYIARRYPLPLTDAQPVLLPLCCAIAMYRLHGNRLTEAVRDAYRDAVRRLESIASGVLSLAVPTVQTPEKLVFVSENSRTGVFRGMGGSRP